MFLILLAAAAAGLGAAGIGFALRKLSGNRIGKWIIPACAGLGILGYQISYEYSWYDNQLLHQAENTIIVSVENTPMFLRPWTYVVPLTTAYTVLDPKNIVYNQQPDGEARLASFILYRIEKAPQDAMKYSAHVLNCNTGELIQLNAQQQPDPAVKMRVLNSEDNLFKQVCAS